MMRYFNAKAGFTKEDDKLPKRLFEKMSDGPSKGVQLDEEKLNQAKELYYDFAGWNKNRKSYRSYTEEIISRLAY